MRIPSAGQLVSVWESGVGQLPTARALEMLAATEPEAARADLARLSVGERDRRLLRMRRALFGSLIDATVVCPACASRVEFDLGLDSVLRPTSSVRESAAIEVDGVLWRVRLPTSIDLLALAPDSNTAEDQLLRRCVSTDEPIRPPLTAAVRDAAVAQMAALDPHADIQIDVSCPACRHTWLADFDIVSFLWTELTGWVRRLLLDVHRLAVAYGWSQADILSMSRQRRAAYLELIGA